MAGDYEYFAAQGYHPLAFALAELIDNSLRATKGNMERPRSITVSLITDDKGSQGVICVSDNGSGMKTQELNNWAIMNLSMEDRGLLNTEEAKGGLQLVWHKVQGCRCYVGHNSLPAVTLECNCCMCLLTYACN